MEERKEKLLVYTIGCPKCKELEELFQEKNIKYDTCKDIKLMIEKGFEYVPMVEIGDKIYNFEQTKKWVEENF